MKEEDEITHSQHSLINRFIQATTSLQFTHMHKQTHKQAHMHSRPALPVTTFNSVFTLRLSVCDVCVVISVKYVCFLLCKYYKDSLDHYCRAALAVFNLFK